MAEICLLSTIRHRLYQTMASLAGYVLSAAPSASTLGLTLSLSFHSSAMTSVLEVSVGQCNYLQVQSGTAKHYYAL